MKSRKVMGLPISPSKSNAKKFAHDLVQLQAEMYHLTNIVNFLDHDADRGHINYELNKFGLAIAAAVKEDLRENPDKKQIKFYLQVLEACWENRNYEIGARIKQGIVDAMLMDIIEPAPGADRFSIPEEDPKIKSARDALKQEIKKLDLWHELGDKDFPPPAESKRIYGEHLQKQESFIPSVQALMNFTAIRLDNAKSLSIDETVPFEKKAMRLFDHKSEILNDLIFIETILEKCVPKSDELNFKKLRAKFNNELSLKLPPTKNDPGKKLDEILKLDRMRNQMRDSVKVLALPVVQPPVSPRTEGMFAVSPRGNKIKLVGLRSNPNSPRSNSASPRDEEPAATSNPSSPRKKMVSVRSEYKSPRNDAVTPRSEAPSPREEKSDRPINPTRPRSPRNK